MDLSIEELKRMQSMHIMELKREELANAEDIVIDTKKCVESRIKIFLWSRQETLLHRMLENIFCRLVLWRGRRT